MAEFTEKVALVTGGSRGIGFATCQAFLENGAKVAFCGKSEPSVRGALSKLARVGEAIGVKADVRNYQEVSDFIDKVIKKYSKIDIVINNAGVAWSGHFGKEETENIGELVDVNVKGVLYTTRAALSQLLSQGNGVIINVSSGAGKSGIPGLATYCATKFAVVGFTESLAKEVVSEGIKVYAICPGKVATDMQADVSGARVGMPAEKVAKAILELSGKNPPVRPGDCLEVYY